VFKIFVTKQSDVNETEVSSELQILHSERPFVTNNSLAGESLCLDIFDKHDYPLVTDLKTRRSYFYLPISVDRSDGTYLLMNHFDRMNTYLPVDENKNDGHRGNLYELIE
jgi:hypothetical protein